MKGLTVNMLPEASSSVWPSGGDLAAASAPSAPPAPGRLSTITDCFQRFPNSSASARPNESVAPPAENGMMIFTGLSGHSSACAAHGMPIRDAMDRQVIPRQRRRVVAVSLTWRMRSPVFRCHRCYRCHRPVRDAGRSALEWRGGLGHCTQCIDEHLRQMGTRVVARLQYSQPANQLRLAEWHGLDVFRKIIGPPPRRDDGRAEAVCHHCDNAFEGVDLHHRSDHDGAPGDFLLYLTADPRRAIETHIRRAFDDFLVGR